MIKDTNEKSKSDNSSISALQEIQIAFDGEADKSGLTDENQVVDFIKSALKD